MNDLARNVIGAERALCLAGIPFRVEGSNTDAITSIIAVRNAGIKSGERNFGSNCFSLVRRLVGTDENKEVRRLGLNRRGGSRVVVRELLIGGLIILSRAARGRGLGGSRGGRSLSGSGGYKNLCVKVY